MPELPEVETIRRGLVAKILQKKIIGLKISQPRIIRNKPADFLKILKNNKITKIDRIGKLLILHLAKGDFYLLIHLKMTGQLIYQHQQEIIAGGHSGPVIDKLPNKHSHLIFKFSDGSRLFFNDVRQFGFLKIVDRKNKDRVVANYGPEPLTANFTLINFQAIFKNKKGILKAFLLNQTKLAGLGNIYADEVCFRAKVKPQRKVNTLQAQDIKNLYQACQYIIKKAVAKRGTTFRDYKDSSGQQGNYVPYLKVYGRQNQICLRCRKALIKKITLAGRGTRYCPQCQK
jgi:formamidopyrimidine-DNA glycosylase